MNNAAKSIVAWGIYALLAGAALLVQPNQTLQLLGFDTTAEHWIRIVALLMMGLGFYYIVLAFSGVRIFFVISTIGRTIFFVATLILIATGKAPGSMLLFGVIDLLSALWTGLALVQEKK